MYAITYRFKLLPEALKSGRRMAEAQFIDVWSGMTEFFKTECGALGSRLHRAQDGAFYAYAQWPDYATFTAASDIEPTDDFTRLRLQWAGLCAPSEILFAGQVEVDLLVKTD